MVDLVSINSVGAVNGIDYCGPRTYTHDPSINLTRPDGANPNPNLAALVASREFCVYTASTSGATDINFGTYYA